MVRDDRTTIRPGRLDSQKESGLVRYDGRKAVAIVVDPAQDGLIPVVLHEALHVVLDGTICGRFCASLQEAIVASVEIALYKRITKSPYQEKRWRVAIGRKLAASLKGDE